MSLVKFNVTRNSPKWTLNSSGNLQSGSDNLPGFEFNPDLTYKGMLVEESRKNLLKQSEIFDNLWSYTNIARDVVSVDAPDGSTTSIKFRVSTTGISYRAQNVLNLNPVKHTFSVFAKASHSNFVRVQAANFDGDTDAFQYFELTGQGSTGTGMNIDNSTIEVYPDGWYRCSITWTQVDTDIQARIFVAQSLESATNSDSNNSILVWGAQIEEGDKASSYIKTPDETVTRNEDVITLTSASQYLPSEGKVTLGWEQREDDTIYIGALSASVASGSRELAYEYSSTEQTLSIDGTEVQTITGQFDFSGMDKIELGHISGSNQPNTHLKYFAVE